MLLNFDERQSSKEADSKTMIDVDNRKTIKYKKSRDLFEYFVIVLLKNNK